MVTEDLMQRHMTFRTTIDQASYIKNYYDNGITKYLQNNFTLTEDMFCILILKLTRIKSILMLFRGMS